jgi:hypothetical protein
MHRSTVTAAPVLQTATGLRGEVELD